MKKYTYILFAAAAILAAMSCNKEINPEIEITPVDNATDEQTLVNPITLTFTATAGSATKVSLDGEGTTGEGKTAKWENGDQIKVIYYANGEQHLYTSNALTEPQAGNASATFTVTVGEDYNNATYVYAVYPASLSCTLEGDSEDSAFKVSFPVGQDAPTEFKGAAWYAARTLKSSEPTVFNFVPISTIIRFTLSQDASDIRYVHFRSMSDNLNKLNNSTTAFTVPFIHDSTRDVDVPDHDNMTSGTSAVNPYVRVNGAGTYYFALPATKQTDNTGFIMRMRPAGTAPYRWRPASYYSTSITLSPGKMYTINSQKPVDKRPYYYVAPDGSVEVGDSSEADYGTSSTNPSSVSDMAAKLSALPNTKAAAYVLYGATINLVGSDTPYGSPLSDMLPSVDADSYSITIQGGVGGKTTTFTTEASSAIASSKATVTLKDITFSGCRSAPALTVSAGTVNLENVKMLSNTSGSISISGGNLEINGGEFTGNTALNGAAIIATNKPTIKINGCSFIENQATSASNPMGGGAIFCNNNNGPTIYLNACCFKDNSTSGQNAHDIYLNSTSKTSFASLCINNSSFYKTTAYDNTNGSLICNKGRTIICNSTLYSVSGNSTWGVFSLGCHKTSINDANGCLLLNNIIVNGTSGKNAVYGHTNYYTISKNCLISADNSSVVTYTATNNTTGAPTFNYNVEGLEGVPTWNGTSPAISSTLSYQDILDELNSKTGETANYALAENFITWLESIKYNYNDTEYNALQVDIRGVPRSTSSYWPGCYQND